MKIAEILVSIFFNRLRKIRPDLLPRMVAAAQQHETKFELALAASLQGLAHLIFPLFPKKWKEYAEDAFARLPTAIMQSLRNRKLETPVEVTEGDVEGLTKDVGSFFEKTFTNVKSLPKTLFTALKHRLEVIDREWEKRYEETCERLNIPKDPNLKRVPRLSVWDRWKKRLEETEKRFEKK